LLEPGVKTLIVEQWPFSGVYC